MPGKGHMIHSGYNVGNCNVKVAHHGEVRYRRGAVYTAKRLIGGLELMLDLATMRILGLIETVMRHSTNKSANGPTVSIHR